MHENDFFLHELKIKSGTNSDTKKYQELTQQLKAKSVTKSSSSDTKLRTLICRRSDATRDRENPIKLDEKKFRFRWDYRESFRAVFFR